MNAYTYNDIYIIFNQQTFIKALSISNNVNTSGELVFNTSVTGYELIMTDPSYKGQIVIFTCPLIGNYGVCNQLESKEIQVSAVICQSLYDGDVFHCNSHTDLISWSNEYNVPIITNADTRELTKMIRDNGNADVVISSDVNNSTTIDFDLDKVSISKSTTYGNGRYKIILVDCGVKENIIRNLLKFDVVIEVVPHNYDYSNLEFDGVLLSNGPGDPIRWNSTIDILKQVLKLKKPIFGICLGQQLISLAIGASTYKLKYGHRGQNHPCIELKTNKCYLTSQNHGYVVDDKTLPDDWEVTYRHLNDNTVAGICHKQLPYFAVQFHPEASPGPNDVVGLFAKFLYEVKQYA